MSANTPPVLVPCPGCGKMVSGEYCSYCGTYLKEDPEEKKYPFLSFASHFLNLENFKHYLKLYFTILLKPVDNTIRIQKEIYFETAVKFMEYSFVFYTLCTVSKYVFSIFPHSESQWFEKLNEIAYSIFVVIGYLIIMKAFYRFASKKYGLKDKRDFIKLYCLYAGFFLPILGIAFTIFGSPLGYNKNETTYNIVKYLTYLLINFCILLYGLFIWKDFWNAPGNKILSLLMIAGAISFTSLFILKIVIYASLGIDL